MNFNLLFQVGYAPHNYFARVREKQFAHPLGSKPFRRESALARDERRKIAQRLLPVGEKEFGEMLVFIVIVAVGVNFPALALYDFALFGLRVQQREKRLYFDYVYKGLFAALFNVAPEYPARRSVVIRNGRHRNAAHALLFFNFSVHDASGLFKRVA